MPGMQRYRRVLVMVQEGHAEAPAFHLAAELAHLLGLEFEGLFVEDEALVALSLHSFARELRLPGHTWQTLDPVRMLEDLHNSAGRARALLAAAAAELGLASTFSVLRADPRAALAERAGAADILVLAEPGAAGATSIRARGRDIFRHGKAGILLLPSRPPKRHGSIAVLLPAAGSDVIEIGAAIARPAAENLVVLAPPGAASAAAEAGLRKAGLPPSRLHRRHLAAGDAGSVARAVSASGARLLVLDRRAATADVQGFLARLQAESGAAVLLLGEAPGPAGAAG